MSGVSSAAVRGEIFGLLGPDGAGKTTIIFMLSGILKPTSGSASVAGFDLARQIGDIKRRIGLVPHNLALCPVGIRQLIVLWPHLRAPWQRTGPTRGRCLKDV